MRLIHKEVKAQPETFIPELIVTVAIPLELHKDYTEQENQESLLEFAREFVELVNEA